MRKLQQFYVMKFPSDRLKKFNYDIKRTIDNARNNQELISLGDSQTLRSIREIRYKNNPKLIKYSTEYLTNLLSKKSNIKKQPNSTENIKTLIDIDNKIDDILFVPEYVAIYVSDDDDYRHLNANGFKLNGIKYVRLSCSASQARADTSIFVDENIEKELKAKLKCGAKDIPITKNKYNAYFALASSSTHTISTPNVLLIKDYEIKMTKRVDWISINEDKQKYENNEYVETLEKELEFNIFDGSGLISIEYAKKISKELKLDYIPAAFCIRCAFVKGMVFTADICEYRNEFAKDTNIVKDYYNNDVNIDNVDIVLTKSMFKLADAYDSMQDYYKLCNDNNFYWGIAKVTPKCDTDYFRSNYQFNQVLNLNNDDIIKLCAPSIEWLSGVAGSNINYSLLYLLGELCNKDIFDKSTFDSLSDNVAKAIMLNNSLINDEYIRRTIIQSINKKIKETYLGKLLLRGCFSVMCPDIVGLMQHALGCKVTGALNENEHYSQYWNTRNVKDVVAMRSPLTWRSEVNKLNLVNNDLTQKYFKYLNSGIVYNMYGCDCMIHADGDYDGDLVATTDNNIFNSCRYDELPITYEKKTVDKDIIKEEELYLADLDSFHSIIGQVTNVSTSMYELLSLFKDNADKEEQYKEIIERLKLTRKAQGDAIDKAKGIKVQKSPYFWTQRISLGKNDTKDVICRKKFINEIVADKHPYFFRYLYYKDNKKYKDYLQRKDKYCNTVFDKTLDDILSMDESNLTPDEINFVTNYYKYMPLINYHGVMNNICNYMEQQLCEIKLPYAYRTPVDVLNIMYSGDNIDLSKLEKMKVLYNQFNLAKIRLKERENSADIIHIEDEDKGFNNFEQFCSYLRKNATNISTSKSELADLAIEICYRVNANRSKEFAWKVFGNYILDNIYNHKQDNIYVPMKVNGEDGNIKYLNNTYILREIEI